jgi:hypothetical protein
MLTSKQTDKKQSTAEALADAQGIISLESSLEYQIDLSILTDDDLRRECKESLVMMMRANKGKLNALASIRELLDRMDGKPAQSIAMTVKQEPVSRLTSDQLAALLAQLPNDPIVIPPMPLRE